MLYKITRIFFVLILFVTLMLLINFRRKKFSFIRDERLCDYPVQRYKIGNVLLYLWLLTFMLHFIGEIVYDLTMYMSVYFFLILTSILYLSLGALPTVTTRNNEIFVELDIINVGSIGMDIFGSWIGSYSDGIIVYDYLIRKDSIRVNKCIDNAIEFTGYTEKENKKINVVLKSKRSINYFKLWQDKNLEQNKN